MRESEEHKKGKKVVRYCTNKVPNQIKIKELLKGNTYAINYLSIYMYLYAASDDYANMTTIFKYAYLNENQNSFKIYDKIMSSAGFESENFNKEKDIKSLKCPYCNGSLIEKVGKSGSFVPCDNYKKCKFSFLI